MDKKTIEKVDLKGKRVFIRADFNVPLDENGNITDDDEDPLHAPDDQLRPRCRRQGHPRLAPRPAQGQAVPEVQPGAGGHAA